VRAATRARLYALRLAHFLAAPSGHRAATAAAADVAGARLAAS
jgi:hypothetical protein